MTGTASTTGRSERGVRALRSALAWLFLLAVAAVLAAAGWTLLFSTFMGYDDEGYLLISLRHFAQFGALYDRVYTQYGPFFFLTFDGLHELFGFAWGSSSARWVTLGFWLASSAAICALVARRTSSRVASAFALAATFAYQICDIYEPSHPGSLIALLVSLAALIGSQSDIGERPWPAAGVGALGAAAALTKINVGGFLLIAALAWLIASGAWPRARRAAIASLGVLLAALPWVLMRPLLANAAVQQLALHTSLSVVAALIAVSALPPARTRARAVQALFFGAAGVSLLTVALIVARGTSVYGLLAGMLLDPLRLPAINFMPVRWLPGANACAGAALLLTCVACLERNSVPVRIAIALIRLGAAIQFARVAVFAPSELPRWGISYGVAIAGLCALPLRFDAAGLSDARARAWLSLLLVLQSLHAFPVAGSQVGWGTFLIAPLLTLAVRDAWLVWVPDRPTARRLAHVSTALVACIALAIPYSLLRGGAGQYRNAELLDLPGAQDLAVPPAMAWTLRALTENAEVHAGMLFSVYGAFSFNLWSGRPTPTSANATLWHALLAPKAQRQIATRLQNDPRAAVIFETGAHPKGELAEYLQRDFEAAFSLPGYTFLVHRGRRIAPISTARLFQIAPNQIALDLTLAPTTRPISQIDVLEIDLPGMPARFHLGPGNAMLEATPLREDDTPSAPTQRVAWPAALKSSLTRLRARFVGQLDAGPVGNRAVFMWAGQQRIAAVPVLR